MYYSVCDRPRVRTPAGPFFPFFIPRIIYVGGGDFVKLFGCTMRVSEVMNDQVNLKSQSSSEAWRLGALASLKVEFLCPRDTFSCFLIYSLPL